MSFGTDYLERLLANQNTLIAGQITILAAFGSGDPNLEMAAGNVAGHSVVNKFGANLSVIANTREDVWDGGGTYSFPTTADITHVSQAVDQVALRGATVEIQGLDINYDLVVQDVVLDAADTTTAVALTTALLRVFRMKVQANVVGDQDIEAHNVGNTTTYAIITAGNNQTLMAIYTVPAGKSGYLTHYFADHVPTGVQIPRSVDFNLWVADRANSYEFQLKHAVATSETKTDTHHYFNAYMKVPEKSDIKVSAFPDNKDAKVHAGFDLILVDN